MFMSYYSLLKKAMMLDTVRRKQVKHILLTNLGLVAQYND